jgi:hypothetical protein
VTPLALYVTLVTRHVTFLGSRVTLLGSHVTLRVTPCVDHGCMPFKDPEARRAYQREYMRKWYREHRVQHLAWTVDVNRRARAAGRQLIAELKSAPCLDCGGRFPPFVMDFDHVRGTKVGIISRMSTGRMAVRRMLDEVEKCDLVCSNCHRLRTQRRLRGLRVDSSDSVRLLGPNYISVLVYA